MTTWRKSSACPNGAACAEILDDGEHIHVRNTKDPRVVVTYDHAEWAAFVAGVRLGEFDVQAGGDA
jgi:hypothetical protein